jgi:mRNA interferase YafQ
MNRKPRVERRFEKDIIRQKGRGKNIEKLATVAALLIQEGKTPSSFHPHKLSGEYEGLWECHLEHDWLLVYEINDTEVIFIRTGTHADLFE